jgi:ABC-type polysaccharide/polyol phosphate export permease
VVIGVRPDPRWPGVGFAALLFAALLPWMAVQEGVLRSVTAITDNANLVKKLRFPSEMLVLSVVSAALLHEAIAAIVFIIVLIGSQILTPMNLLGAIPLLLMAIVLQLLLTLGLGLIGAAAHVFFRDFGQILGIVFLAWFYLTPIVYPLTAVPERWRNWVAWNPLTPIVDLYRQAFFGGGQLIVPDGIWLLALGSALLAWIGLRLFARLKPSFADEV